jgi:hypothetical protein
LQKEVLREGGVEGGVAEGGVAEGGGGDVRVSLLRLCY